MSASTQTIDSSQEVITRGIRALQLVIHERNRLAGWWSDLDTGEDLSVITKRVAIDDSPDSRYLTRVKRNVPEMIALMHSELSEALEGYRKMQADDKLPHRPMIEVEFADVIIRLLDCAGGLELDVAGAIFEKLEFNAHRADHKLEARRAPGGKSI